jgi:hypothetical protein
LWSAVASGLPATAHMDLTITAPMLTSALRAKLTAGRRINQALTLAERDERERRWVRLCQDYETLIRAAPDAVLREHDEPLAKLELRRRDEMVV